MAKIYTDADGIQIPELDFKDIKAYEEKVKQYEKDLRDFCIRRNPDQDGIGEVITFPVADGKACYMVAGLKPVELIHMQIWDAWHYQMAHRLTKKDVLECIRREKAIRELFSKKG